MNRNLLVLLPCDSVFLELKNIKTQYYRTTGDYSVYKIPPVLILGKTKFNKFDRMSINTNILIDTNTEKSSIGTILPVSEIEEFTPLYNKYDIEKINGFYICENDINMHIKLSNITKLKLAMLKYTEEGYILLQ